MSEKMIGVTVDVHMNRAPLSELLTLLARIEGLGYESIWSPDAMARDPYLLSAYMLANSNTIRVGTAVANMYAQDPVAAAQARLTLSEQYPDRFLMGLGVSVAFMNEQRNAETISPVVKQTQYLKGVREARLVTPAPSVMAPVFAAAHGPRLQQIAGEHADGIMTWAMPPEHISLSRARLQEGSLINAGVAVIDESDPEVARAAARSFIALWMQLPHYRKAWVSAGFSESDFEGNGSDRFIDAMFAWGSLDDIVGKLNEYHAAGADRIILSPLKYSQELTDHAGAQQTVQPAWDVLNAIAGRML